jgi:hypothetical protein
LELCQLAVQAGLADRAQQLANQIADTGLKGQAQLAVFRTRLNASKEKVDDSLAAGIAEKTGAAALAREALARHNGKVDSSMAKNVESWDEGDRAAGLAGLALGMQDKRK